MIGAPNLAAAILLYLPSPSFSSFRIGPLTVHMYALCIMAGIVAGWFIARRRFIARGGDPEQLESVLAWAVLAGVVGARIYHVITDYQLYFGPGRNPWDALKIWQGGLGIWGAIAGGGLAVWIQARRRGWDFGSLADVIAPALLISQGIGRLGNWFNQELFGRPTSLPWAVEIDPVYRPAGYGDYQLFHPTFLYEMLWCFAGYAVLVWAEKRFRLGHGRVFALYVAWYTLGRSFIERLRIDPVNTVGGFRLNQYTSVILLVASVATFVWLSIRRPGVAAHPFGTPSKDEDESADSSQTAPDEGNAATQ